MLIFFNIKNMIIFASSIIINRIMAEHNELGKNGENFAVEFLEGKGYQIITRNWRCGNNELDIVA